MKSLSIVVIVTIFTFVNFGCRNPSLGAPWKLFESPEEILKSPRMQESIGRTNFPINWGDRVPDLTHVYHFAGEIIDADPIRFENEDVQSYIEFFDQTSNGEISMRESNNDRTLNGTGVGYVTGYGIYHYKTIVKAAYWEYFFTIWLHSETNLGGGAIIRSIVLINGHTSWGDTFDVDTLTTTIQKINCEKFIVANWFRMDGKLSETVVDTLRVISDSIDGGITGYFDKD